MCWSEFQAKERPAPLGPLWESGFTASIKVRACVCVCVCVVQVGWKGKRRLCRVDRKREGWNNYVSAQRLFDLLKMQEKGVSPLCQYIQCFTLWKHNTLCGAFQFTLLKTHRSAAPLYKLWFLTLRKLLLHVSWRKIQPCNYHPANLHQFFFFSFSIDLFWLVWLWSGDCVMKWWHLHLTSFSFHRLVHPPAQPLIF